MFAELEHAVMTMLLAGDDPELEVLRAQYASSTVVKRDFTGVGNFTSFSVDRSLPAVERPMRINDVMAEATGVSDSVGFILWVENGFIDNLESWTTGDWTDPNADLVRAYYIHRVAPDSPSLVETPTRDLGYALHDTESYRTPAEKRHDRPPGIWRRIFSRRD